MNVRIVFVILRKELMETLRDKRTLIAMIGIPVLLYPMLIIASAQVLSVQQSKMEHMQLAVSLAPPDPNLNHWIQSIDNIQIVSSANPDKDLRDGNLHAVVKGPGDTASILTENGSVEIHVEYDSAEVASREAANRIKDGLLNRSDQLLQQRLQIAGLDDAFARPLKIEAQNIASDKKRSGSALGSVLPMIMIVMLGVGAFYPAVDLTAGEKERGTYETLLSTPTTKLEIVCGKFVTIFCLSMFTGLLNLGSMVLSMTFALSQMKSGAEEQTFDLSLMHITWANIALIFIVLIPLAFFICAVMMSIALLARDFKEAQNLVTPFFLIILLPGVFVGMPGIELTRGTVFIPIANVALLFKNLLIERANADLFFGVLICTAVYALLALLAAVWLFQREEVILAEEKGFPLSLRRSSFVPRPSPTPGLALMLFALALLLIFYVGTYVQGRDLVGGLLITQWILLLGTSVFILWYVRVDLRRSLQLYYPGLGPILATILIAAGSLVLVLQMSTWQHQVMPMPESLTDQMSEMFKIDKTASLVILLLATAVSPAICEEVLFRGAILSGLRTKLSSAACVIVVGVLFGLFHLSLYRFVPTAALGMAITYVVLRSSSLFVGMLFHLLVNATLVLATNPQQLPEGLGDFVNKIEQHDFPWWLLLVAVAVFGAGVCVLELTKSKERLLRPRGNT